jgi:glycosyltransferase involved in cell wall biosynthesis
LFAHPVTLCFVSDTYPLRRPFGGMAVYTQTAAQALSARGHTVHVLVPCSDAPADLTDGAVQVHYRRVSWLPLIGRMVPALGESRDLAQALRELHRAHCFDLVEFPNFEGLGLVSAWQNFVPVVVRLHTSMAESVETEGRAPRAGERFMMWAERQSARLARGVVTHSRAHRGRSAKIYGRADIQLIPHGIRIPAERTSMPADPAVLTLGRLSPRKGGPALLAAIPLVFAQVPNLTWTIVGAAEAHPLVQALRAAHPALPRERVVFHEFLGSAEIDALYAEATVYASASVYESFGLTFVEAMARGLPVVGCATSAMTEIITHEQTGLLVPPAEPAPFAEAVTRLLQDAPLRARLGAEGRQVAVAQYSAERMATDIEAWYRQVLAG